MERLRDALLMVVLFLAGAAVYSLVEDRDSTREGASTLSRPAVELKGSNGEVLTAAEIYERASGGVASISTSGGRGSGFLISREGEVLTNSHVVHSQGDIRVEFADGTQLPARVAGDDPSTDLALLQITGPVPQIKPLALGDSRNLIVGDGVVAIGNPFGLEQTLTTGVISALARTITAPNGFAINQVIQTDAAINPGNSGGPLLNARGQIIGINSQIASASGQSSGIGFAIPINTAKSLLPQLREGVVKHGYLGVTAKATPGKPGLSVLGIAPGSAAEAAGIEVGDQILEVNGAPVRSIEQLQGIISQRLPGDIIGVKLSSDGQTRELKVKLGDRDQAIGQ